MRIVFYALWVPIAVLAALAVARIAWRETRTPLVALLAGLIAAAGLVAFPRTVDDTASAASRDHAYRAAQTTRKSGREDCLVEYVTCVREDVWVRLRQLIPEHDSYYVDTGSARIRFWTYTSLLPRIAVPEAHDADWVIAYQDDPRTLGLRYSRIWTIGPVATRGRRDTIVLAKVAP